MKVFVYWNLHKKTWSIKAMGGPQRGRVIAHATRVTLTGAYPKVSEKGRQRVLLEQKKNVHAGVVGTLVTYKDTPEPIKATGAYGVTYNPYKGPQFTHVATGGPWTGVSDIVIMDHKKVYSITGEQR